MKFTFDEQMRIVSNIINDQYMSILRLSPIVPKVLELFEGLTKIFGELPPLWTRHIVLCHDKTTSHAFYYDLTYVNVTKGMFTPVDHLLGCDQVNNVMYALLFNPSASTEFMTELMTSEIVKNMLPHDYIVLPYNYMWLLHKNLGGHGLFERLCTIYGHKLLNFANVIINLPKHQNDVNDFDMFIYRVIKAMGTRKIPSDLVQYKRYFYNRRFDTKSDFDEIIGIHNATPKELKNVDNWNRCVSINYYAPVSILGTPPDMYAHTSEELEYLMLFKEYPIPKLFHSINMYPYSIDIEVIKNLILRPDIKYKVVLRDNVDFPVHIIASHVNTPFCNELETVKFTPRGYEINAMYSLHKEWTEMDLAKFKMMADQGPFYWFDESFTDATKSGIMVCSETINIAKNTPLECTETIVTDALKYGYPYENIRDHLIPEILQNVEGFYTCMNKRYLAFFSLFQYMVKLFPERGIAILISSYFV